MKFQDSVFQKVITYNLQLLLSYFHFKQPPCEIGTYCDDGKVFKTCGPGYYCDRERMVEPNPCPKGFFCDGSQAGF